MAVGQEAGRAARAEAEAARLNGDFLLVAVTDCQALNYLRASATRTVGDCARQPTEPPLSGVKPKVQNSRLLTPARMELLTDCQAHSQNRGRRGPSSVVKAGPSLHSKPNFNGGKK